MDLHEDSEQSGAKIVKRFRARATYARFFDKARATREFQGLRKLEARRVRVPHAIEIGREEDGTWVVSLEAIPGALTATAALEAASNKGALLVALAQLLADLHNAGADQSDLHGGNALVDLDGNCYGIDFHGARIRAEGTLGRSTLLRDLSVLAASHREWIRPSERSRFLVAWLRALAPAQRAQIGPRSNFARAIEQRGVSIRRKACAEYEHQSSRWFRDSSSCRLTGETLFASRALPQDLSSNLVRQIEEGTQQLPSGLWLFRGTEPEVRNLWGRAARISAHRLPGPRPCLMSLGDNPWVLLEFALQDSPDAQFGECGIFELSIGPTRDQFAPLERALADRGLALRRGMPAAFWSTVHGQLCLSPHAELIPSTTRTQSKDAKHKRRESRQKWFQMWPRFQAPGIRPLANFGLHSLAACARVTPLQKSILANLAVTYPGPENEKRRRQIATHVRHHMARLAGEWGRFGRGEAERDWLESRVCLDDSISLFDEQLARGRGVLIVTPHLGNWELLAPKLVARGCSGAVVGRRRLRDPAGALPEQMRAPWGFDTLPQDGSPREILRRLRAGQVIGILPDLEVPRLAGIRLPFLGKEALVMTAPAALARAARVPLLPATCVLDETPDGRPDAHSPYRLKFAPPIERRAIDGNEPATRAWIDVFEDWIHKAPSQWIWYLDRWRTPPSPADAVPLATLRASQKDSAP